MDKNRQPGIIFENVFLASLHFELPQIPRKKSEKISYDLIFNEMHTIKNDRLAVEISVEIYKGFNLKIVGIFRLDGTNKNMALEKFAQANAPALLFPYIREIVSDITSKSYLPPLRLPPINVLALIRESNLTKIQK